MFAEKICILIENEKLRYSMGIRAREHAKLYTKKNIMYIWNRTLANILKMRD